MTVANRSILKGAACECYGIIRQQFERLCSAKPQDRVSASPFALVYGRISGERIGIGPQPRTVSRNGGSTYQALCLIA